MTRYLPRFFTSFMAKYAREWGVCLLVLVSAVCTLSLYFHVPTDCSWFFYTTERVPILNVCGYFGAYSSALLLYVFGASAWFFLAMLFFYSYVLFIERGWRAEWDRLAAFMILIMASSAWFYAHTIGFYAGGALGVLIYTVSLYIFDHFAAQLFFSVLSTVSVVIIMRDILMVSIRLASPLIRFACSRRLWGPLYRLCSEVIRRSTHSLVRLVVYVKEMAPKQVADDSACGESNAYATQELHEDSHSLENIIVQEQESEPKSAAWHEDQLWQEYEQVDGVDSSTDRSVQQEQQAVSDLQGGESDKPILPEQPAEKKKTYMLPNVSIFIGVDDESDDQQLMQELEARAKILEEKLERFGVSGKVVSIKRGPVVTLFEYRPHIDSKISKIIALEDDLALALQAMSIRIIAPIPGRSVVGFEVANKHRRGVFLASVVQSPVFKEYSGALPLALGQDTIGNTVVVDLVRMPHLLIAGSTGSGKSVALNAMLVSLLCKMSPEQLRLILIDPKRLEFASYADIAHLLFPIVTNPKEAGPILRWVVRTMEERYELMAESGVRSIDDYNRAIELGRSHQEKMPYILVIIDELSDLMMTAGKEIEDLIARITQMARAAGIHMIVATQRPSVDVITGLIKVNFPSRISFRVTSKIDSRTILDCAGADKLLGRGDMLFLDSCQASLRRIHGAYVSDKEIEELVAHIRNERPTDYLDITQEMPAKDDLLHEADDVLYSEIMAFLETVEEVSISLLQRKFRIGYNRSARIIDKLELEGAIEPSTGGKTRKVRR